MSSDLIGREPLDDPLLAELRSVLDEVETGPDGWPSTMPPWEHLAAGMRRTRRRRRVRRGAGVLAGAMAVILLTAGVGLALGRFPAQRAAPSAVPSDVPPGPHQHSALFDQPTRGSLAGDRAWVTAMHDRAAGPRKDENGKVYRKGASGPVKVLFAGDVGTVRAALVEGTWPNDEGYSWVQQEWWAGTVGDTPGELESLGNGPDPRVAATLISSMRPGENGFAVIVVTSGKADVTLQASPDIDAAGRVTQHLSRVPESAPGLYTAYVDDAGRYRVWVGGRAIERSAEVRTKDGATARSGGVPLRGGDPQRGTTDLGRSIRDAAGQPSWSGSFRTLVSSAGTAGRKTDLRPWVGVVTLPSGARLLGAGGLGEVDGGTATSLVAVELLPAGPVDDLAIVFRTPWPGPGGGTGTAAMGPARTASVEWVRDDGSVTPGSATNTLAVITADDVRSVRFLDASGRLLATRSPVEMDRLDRMLPQIAITDPPK